MVVRKEARCFWPAEALGTFYCGETAGAHPCQGEGGIVVLEIENLESRAVCHQNQPLRLPLTKSLCLQKFWMKGLQDHKENSLGWEQSAVTHSWVTLLWTQRNYLAFWRNWIIEAPDQTQGCCWIMICHCWVGLQEGPSVWELLDGGWDSAAAQLGFWAPSPWACFLSSSTSQGCQGNQKPAEFREGGT